MSDEPAESVAIQLVPLSCVDQVRLDFRPAYRFGSEIALAINQDVSLFPAVYFSGNGGSGCVACFLKCAPVYYVHSPFSALRGNTHPLSDAPVNSFVSEPIATHDEVVAF